MLPRRRPFFNEGQHLSVIPDTDMRNSSQMGQILLSGGVSISRSCPQFRTALTGFLNQTKLPDLLSEERLISSMGLTSTGPQFD
jgi:hypothetical protein